MRDQWQERVRPLRLEKRYEFDTYDELRDFLDAAATISEKLDCYPDMGFGKDYVNVTIHIEEGETEIKEELHTLAKLYDEILLNS